MNISQFRQPVTQGEDSCLGTVGDLQLRENGADVVLDRPFRQEQALGNFSVGQAPDDQAQHVQLAFAEQAGDLRVGRSGQGAAELIEQFSRYGWIDVAFPFHCAVDGGKQLLAGGILQ